MIKRLQQHLVWVIMLPVLVVAVYIGYYMTDRYAAEAAVMVKQNAQGPSVSGLGEALGLGSASAGEDERLLLAYVHSPDLLARLQEELDIRSHYSNPEIDWYSRLPEDATREEFLEYYRNHVSIAQDGTTGLLEIEAQAFDPEFALALNRWLLQFSEAFVNEINQALADQQVAFMRQEVDRAQETLRVEKQAILNFQNANRTFSPEGQSQALSSVINTLESELVQEETQLSQFQSYLNEDAPQIVSTRSRIAALRQEIERQKSRLVGQGENNLNELNAEYNNLLLNLEFATNAYTTALSAFEQARAEASRKLRNLVVVSSPQLAEEARYPERTYWIITWLLGAILVFAIARLILSIIREHKD
ncbi:hypothetical protein [Saccharospirillum sp.]|uniref:hypothetical protein n=1 Tax=Saccharospirillum sp. TaxID=2033801 RepID=UPI0034A02C2B